MLIRRKSDIVPSEITPERVYRQRRQLIATALAAAPALLVGCNGDDANAAAKGGGPAAAAPPPAARSGPYANVAKSRYSTNEQLSSFRDITTYNNFYEFGLAKDAPARNARLFRTQPWKVKVAGHAGHTGTFDFDDLVGKMPLEERIYRMRCVEGWSMVIPWVGFPLAALLKRFQPTSRAKYVAFRTLLDPSQMPGQNSGVLDWPYEEGLRIDEAMHPLTILAVGLYGQALPNQNGAPLRLVVPWKYGFKGIKSIAEIHFVESEPATSWNKATPGEYGFYSNVNPDVAHPRWSQATERRIAEGSSLFAQRIKTRMFNGYDDVAPLYAGMDLKKHF